MDTWGLVEIRFNSSSEIHIYSTQEINLDWLTNSIPKVSIDDSSSSEALGIWRYVITGVKDMVKTATWAVMKRLSEDGWEIVSRSDDYYATHFFKKRNP